MWTIYSFYERKPWAAYIVMLVSVKNKKKKKLVFIHLYTHLFFYCVLAERMYWGATSVVFALGQKMNNRGGSLGLL